MLIHVFRDIKCVINIPVVYSVDVSELELENLLLDLQQHHQQRAFVYLEQRHHFPMVKLLLTRALELGIHQFFLKNNKFRGISIILYL